MYRFHNNAAGLWCPRSYYIVYLSLSWIGAQRPVLCACTTWVEIRIYRRKQPPGESLSLTIKIWSEALHSTPDFHLTIVFPFFLGLALQITIHLNPSSSEILSGLFLEVTHNYWKLLQCWMLWHCTAVSIVSVHRVALPVTHQVVPPSSTSAAVPNSFIHQGS